MSYTVVIPARYEAQRFPGKLLACLQNKPVLQHVVERAQQSQATKIIVATDDERILDAVQTWGVEVCMTAKHHQSGTERIAEVIELKQLKPESIIVNVQGDEPFIAPENIDQVAQILQSDVQRDVATLYDTILSPEDYKNPNVVKVVFDTMKRALYFSRAPIPFARNQASYRLDSAYRHIGIYGYRAHFIHRYIEWTVSPLEQIECLEQLRILWHGTAIHMEPAIAPSFPGIDTPDDLKRYQHHHESTE